MLKTREITGKNAKKHHILYKCHKKTPNFILRYKIFLKKNIYNTRNKCDTVTYQISGKEASTPYGFLRNRRKDSN